MSALPEEAFRRIEARFHQVWLVPEAQLVKPGQPPEFVYFPESGAVSIVACAPGDRLGHVGLYGYEGAGNAAAMLGAPHASFLEVVQFAGYAQRIAVRDLHDAMSACPELRSLLHSYAHILMTQIAIRRWPMAVSASTSGSPDGS